MVGGQNVSMAGGHNVSMVGGQNVSMTGGHNVSMAGGQNVSMGLGLTSILRHILRFKRVISKQKYKNMHSSQKAV